MLRRILRFTLAGLAAGFIVIQFVPVDRSNPAVITDVAAPPHIDAILRRSCYDCHSNETRWPWYSRVAPVSWLVARDVREGRAKLNFSAWNTSPDAEPNLMHKILESIDEREMPMTIYLAMHPRAALSAADVAAVREWSVARGALLHTEHEDESNEEQANDHTG